MIVDSQVHISVAQHEPQMHEVARPALIDESRVQADREAMIRQGGKDSAAMLAAEKEGRLGAEGLVAAMDEAGVDAAIIIPPLDPGAQPNNMPYVESALRYPARLAVMGRLVAEEARQVAQLKHWRRVPGMLGVRVSFRSRGPDHSDYEAFWAAAERFGIPVMANCARRLDEIRHVALRHPGLRVAIDHLGLQPSDGDSSLLSRVQPLIRLADIENISVKASCVPALVPGEVYPFPSIRTAMSAVIESFSSERVFWGSDLSRLPCRYSDLVKFFQLQLDFLESDDVNAVLGGSLVRWLDWEIQSD
jgi:predicted TIM-barrel fold metal-dependent hydrolase